MESDRIPLSSVIFFGTENNSESRFGNWETCNHGGEGLIQRLGTYWLMGMLVAWAQGLLGRKRIGPLHMDFLWVISSARVGSEAVDSRVEDFASSTSRPRLRVLLASAVHNLCSRISQKCACSF